VRNGKVIRKRLISVVAWGEPYPSPLWESRRDGLAYVCEHFACQAPQHTPEGLRAQLDAH